MERTWKKTLAAGIAAVVIVVALVLAGGRLTDHTAPADQGSSAMQQTDADRQREQTLDPDDPDVVGPKQNGNREVTGSTTGNSGGQDQYHTDPVPEGRPEPVEPDNVEVDTDTSLTCTISISCATILDNMELCAENKRPLVPSDGVILPTTSVTFSEGESVYDVLQSVCRSYNIHMESSWTPLYNSAYIEGINNLYEFDVGKKSGWMYKVNGWFPNYGCSRYQVQNGDTICFVYTCDLGADVGDNSMSS
mgnify:CR=1 FL=1